MRWEQNGKFVTYMVSMFCQSTRFASGVSAWSPRIITLKLSNSTKTESSCFHLNNREARSTLKVYMGDHLLVHNLTPNYLGVTLDRTLSFKQHLMKLRGKLATRNNILRKLTASSWGSNASTLRTSALSLVYSTAEYCSPVWINSCHTSLVDTQLNSTMRVVSGTVRSTPTPWLPVLSDIAPPDLRRKNALLREYQNAINSPNMPLHDDLQLPPPYRLKSRHPPLVSAVNLINNHFSVNKVWSETWSQSQF